MAAATLSEPIRRAVGRYRLAEGVTIFGRLAMTKKGLSLQRKECHCEEAVFRPTRQSRHRGQPSHRRTTGARLLRPLRGLAMTPVLTFQRPVRLVRHSDRAGAIRRHATRSPACVGMGYWCGLFGSAADISSVSALLSKTSRITLRRVTLLSMSAGTSSSPRRPSALVSVRILSRRTLRFLS